MPAHYGFCAAADPETIQALVTRLVNNGTFAFGNPDRVCPLPLFFSSLLLLTTVLLLQRLGPYRNKIFVNLAQRLWFFSLSHPGIEYAPSFDPLPLELFAFMCTAVCLSSLFLCGPAADASIYCRLNVL